MPETDIKKFKYVEFSTDLVKQASQVVPADIAPNDKNFIIDIILRFCKMAGEALVNEKNSKLNATEASIVVQFIGEWIFHKSIDIIRAKIPEQYREGILQKIAFTVFEIAKRAIEKQIPQEQLISLVEAQVKKCFSNVMEELKTKGIINDELEKNALSQSNIDAMAQQQAEETIEKESDPTDSMEDSKLIKLASFAILISNFSPERIKNILQKFNKPEREVLIKYLKMPDLVDKLDSRTTMKCFDEIKNALPETVVISYDKAYNKVCKIIKKSSKDKISNIIINEKPKVRGFVNACYNKKREKISAHIADTISKYLEENVS